MRNTHTGFVGQSGVQAHSAGDYFPITEVCVGGWPPSDSNAFWRIQAPCGIYADACTQGSRDAVLQIFKFAHETSNRYEGINEAERFANAVVSFCDWVDLHYTRGV